MTILTITALVLPRTTLRTCRDKILLAKVQVSRIRARCDYPEFLPASDSAIMRTDTGERVLTVLPADSTELSARGCATPRRPLNPPPPPTSYAKLIALISRATNQPHRFVLDQLIFLRHADTFVQITRGRSFLYTVDGHYARVGIT